jgi:hypothetical protein
LVGWALVDRQPSAPDASLVERSNDPLDGSVAGIGGHRPEYHGDDKQGAEPKERHCKPRDLGPAHRSSSSTPGSDFGVGHLLSITPQARQRPTRWHVTTWCGSG